MFDYKVVALGLARLLMVSEFSYEKKFFFQVVKLVKALEIGIVPRDISWSAVNVLTRY